REPSRKVEGMKRSSVGRWIEQMRPPPLPTRRGGGGRMMGPPSQAPFSKLWTNVRSPPYAQRSTPRQAKPASLRDVPRPAWRPRAAPSYSHRLPPRGGRPTVLPMPAQDDATLLERYHAQPGRTVPTLGPFRDEQGRSSYEVLAEETGTLH